ncbi:conserved protein of unknown function (plasmid) [Rhodovastum atsumiense]|uniref:Anti-CBASS protein Acb1 n=1 Tax=Rhodovastum atsumiense TaxID=504468 RepID=A0A5M6IWM5_9PROT|nr:anti-CBASS Acb1 family protein [Rhodovastum atsumiense]KAA5611868.1 DUF1073 domain-containing protein [Rhodovastum atsumiense]CAH2606154.1 conserved protein of unknown function [Rhodovastum atsumiense]
MAHALYDAIDATAAGRLAHISQGSLDPISADAALSDSLRNLVSGLGTERDKATHGRFANEWLDKFQLDAMYQSDWLAGKIIDAPADDMTREWRTWNGPARAVAAVDDAEEDLRVRERVNHVLKLARLYGGAGIYIGVGEDADPAKELDVASIQRGDIRYLHVLSRYELWAGNIDRDPVSPYFGEPEYYMMSSPTAGGVRIHPSRVVRFLGQARLELSRQVDGWGLPVLQRLYDAIRDAVASNQGLAAMVQEAKVDVIKVKGLTQNAVDEGWRRRTLARFSLANQAKSLVGAMLLDAEEAWEQKKLSLADMPKVISTFLEIASGAADMPVSRLLGTAPGGLNSTGEADIRHYYDSISARQRTELSPGLRRLDEAIKRHAGVGKRSVSYTWNSLWQMTDAERADIGLKNAQRTQVVRQTGLVPVRALAQAERSRLVQSGEFPALEDALQQSEARRDPDFTMPSASAQAPSEPRPSPRPIEAGDAAGRPRTLYVSRPVLNAADIIAWARSHGFASTLEADDLHVTVAFSRKPLDWAAVGSDWETVSVAPGGKRQVKALGDKGAVVLRFDSGALTERWRQIIAAGASWDHDGFQPHVTITYAGGDVDPASVQPYDGPLVLGAERFAEVNEDWLARVREEPAGS